MIAYVVEDQQENYASEAEFVSDWRALVDHWISSEFGPAGVLRRQPNGDAWALVMPGVPSCPNTAYIVCMKLSRRRPENLIDRMAYNEHEKQLIKQGFGTPTEEDMAVAAVWALRLLLSPPHGPEPSEWGAAGSAALWAGIGLARDELAKLSENAEIFIDPAIMNRRAEADNV